VALPFTLKKRYLKAKEEELWKLKYISPCKKYILIFKKSSKRNLKILQDNYYNSIIITNLKFQHKPKIYHLSKIPI